MLNDPCDINSKLHSFEGADTSRCFVSTTLDTSDDVNTNPNPSSLSRSMHGNKMLDRSFHFTTSSQIVNIGRVRT